MKTIEHRGITPTEMLAKCLRQYGDDLLVAVKEETRRVYSNTGYLADNLRVETTPDGGRIVPPAGRLESPQTNNTFLARVWARVAATFIKEVR